LGAIGRRPARPRARHSPRAGLLPTAAILAAADLLPAAVLFCAALLPTVPRRATAATPPPDAAALAFSNRDYARARALWAARAGKGDPQALYQLGLLADLGEGEAPDARKAYALYRRAAEAGSVAATFNVATMQDNGRGTAHDAAGAAVWYGRAASHGDRRAEYDLGLLYQDGDGVPANPAMARAWFQAASRAGLPAARGKLGTPPPRPENARLRRDPRLLPAVPSWPAPGAVLPIAAAELVWSAPAETVAVQYFVEVQDRQTGREIMARYVDVSAVLVTLPPAVHAARWRVFVVSPATASYMVGAWNSFDSRAAS